MYLARRFRVVNVSLWSFWLLAGPMTVIAQPTVTLTSVSPSPQPVGTPVVWTALASRVGPSAVYRFSEREASANTWNLVQDFSESNLFEWTTLQEGSYQITVEVLDPATNGTAQKVASFQFTSRVKAGIPVVSATQNPLVFLYSAPPCTVGSVRVAFGTGGGGPSKSTPFQKCSGAASLNFYLAGLLANTRYEARQQLVDHGATLGPPVSFQTGNPPLTFPSFAVVSPVDANTDTAQSVFLNAFGSLSNSPGPTGTDLAGNLLWYYQFSPQAWPSGTYLSRPIPGGTMTLIVGTSKLGSQFFQEIGLAGNLVRQTNTWAINHQLAALGVLDQVSWLSHEGLRLPNGHTLTFGSVERLMTGVQGAGTVDVLGDMIIDLDQNLRITWTWNAFDFLNPAQAAILGGWGCVGLDGKRAAIQQSRRAGLIRLH